MSSVPRTRLDTDVRRRQILHEARRLFATRDYSSVSMQDIAEAAGVARGLLNHYFGSKRELYLEVARDLLRVAALPLRADGDTDADLWERSVDGWLDLVDANRESWLAAVRAGESGHDPELRQIIDDASEAVGERVLAALGVDAVAVSPELRAVVRCYGGLAQEATREWLERGRLTRAQVRVLLTGTMPLIAQRLVPDVLAAGLARTGRASR
ncbi:MAG TPA: helix-turn-helix domain-containing protein [Acidimicrobiales bacterium]|nr:helix-turn-helix domain-containing protein [Acidimicrobiales bacterium]